MQIPLGWTDPFVQEVQIGDCLRQYKEKYEALHDVTRNLHQKYQKLKLERDKYCDEVTSLKEEIRRLKTRWAEAPILY